MAFDLHTTRTIFRQCGLILAGISLGMLSPAVALKTNRRFIDIFTKNAMGFFIIFDLSVILIVMTILNDGPLEILAVARLMTYVFEAIVRFICFEMMIKRIMMQQGRSTENTLVHFYRVFVVLNCLVEIALSVGSFTLIMSEHDIDGRTLLTDTGLRIVRVTYYSFALLIGGYYDIALIRQLRNHVNPSSEIISSTVSVDASNNQVMKLYLYIAADQLLAILVIGVVAGSFSFGYLEVDTYVICFESTFSFRVLLQMKKFISEIFNQRKEKNRLSESNNSCERQALP